ncbi:hypothetical protein LX36DRAFT_347754 [Colletotrichum falcatum]|nr:hypothetical protein LX36DRAFT_347754 [Colletotrichum falcatum]
MFPTTRIACAAWPIVSGLFTPAQRKQHLYKSVGGAVRFAPARHNLITVGWDIYMQATTMWRPFLWRSQLSQPPSRHLPIDVKVGVIECIARQTPRVLTGASSVTKIIGPDK